MIRFNDILQHAQFSYIEDIFENRTVLVFGACDGSLLKQISNTAFKVSVVDPRYGRESYLRNRFHLKNCNYYQSQLYETHLLDHSFDLIYCSDFNKSYLQDERYLIELKRLLDPIDGVLACSLFSNDYYNKITRGIKLKPYDFENNTVENNQIWDINLIHERFLQYFKFATPIASSIRLASFIDPLPYAMPTYRVDVGVSEAEEPQSILMLACGSEIVLEEHLLVTHQISPYIKQIDEKLLTKNSYNDLLNAKRHDFSKTEDKKFSISNVEKPFELQHNKDELLYNQNIAQLNKQEESHHDLLDSLNKKITYLENKSTKDLEEYNSNVQELKSRLLEEEIKWKKSIEILEENHNATQKQIQNRYEIEKENQLTEYQKLESELQWVTDQLNSELSQKKSEILSLSQSISNIDDRFSVSEKTYTKEKDGLLSKIEEQNLTIKALESEIVNLKIKSEDLTIALEEAEGALDAAETLRRDLYDQYTLNTDALNKERNQVAALRNTLDELTREQFKTNKSFKPAVTEDKIIHLKEKDISKHASQGVIYINSPAIHKEASKDSHSNIQNVIQNAMLPNSSEKNSTSKHFSKKELEYIEKDPLEKSLNSLDSENSIQKLDTSKKNDPNNITNSNPPNADDVYSNLEKTHPSFVNDKKNDSELSLSDPSQANFFYTKTDFLETPLELSSKVLASITPMSMNMPINGDIEIGKDLIKEKISSDKDDIKDLHEKKTAEKNEPQNENSLEKKKLFLASTEPSNETVSDLDDNPETNLIEELPIIKRKLNSLAISPFEDFNTTEPLQDKLKEDTETVPEKNHVGNDTIEVDIVQNIADNNISNNVSSEYKKNDDTIKNYNQSNYFEETDSYNNHNDIEDDDVKIPIPDKSIFHAFLDGWDSIETNSDLNEEFSIVDNLEGNLASKPLHENIDNLTTSTEPAITEQGNEQIDKEDKPIKYNFSNSKEWDSPQQGELALLEALKNDSFMRLPSVTKSIISSNNQTNKPEKLKECDDNISEKIDFNNNNPDQLTTTLDIKVEEKSDFLDIMAKELDSQHTTNEYNTTSQKQKNAKIQKHSSKINSDAIKDIAKEDSKDSSIEDIPSDSEKPFFQKIISKLKK